MKIIEKKDYTAWRHTFTCVRCESKLEAEPSDVRGTHHEGWTDPTDNSGSPAHWTYEVACVVCGQKHSIPELNLPKALQHEIQEQTHLRRTPYNNQYDR